MEVQCFDDKFAMFGIVDFKASTNQLTTSFLLALS